MACHKLDTTSASPRRVATPGCAGSAPTLRGWRLRPDHPGMAHPWRSPTVTVLLAVCATTGFTGVDHAPRAFAGGCMRPADATVVRVALSGDRTPPTVQSHKFDVIRVRVTAPKGYGDTFTYPEPARRAWAVCHLASWRPSKRTAIATFLAIHVPIKRVLFTASCRHPSPQACLVMFGRVRIIQAS